MTARKILLTAALAALAPAVLLAQAPPLHGGHEGGRGGLLRNWDTNRDGTVTRDEAQQAASDQAARRFDAIDLNKDGVIDEQEVREALQARRDALRARFDERFKAADTDGDGSLSKEEAEKGMPMLVRRFEQLDANQDGKLSQDELKQAGRRWRRPG